MFGGAGFVHNGGGGRNDACDVLQNKPSCIAVIGNVEQSEEKAGPRVLVEAGAPAGDGEILAGEPSNDRIHSATKRSTIEGENVGPDSSLVQASFLATRNQDCGCVSFPLNVADGAIRDAQVREPGSQSLAEHADSGEELDGTDGVGM